ncbi:MAG: hypothetical protein J5599_09540 [Spirochaetales bacterium]|nr:hypothetical protein [Spirochaetales bacterium]
MKKVALILVFLSICLFVFADTQSSTEAATLTDNSFVIKAYYKGAVTTTVSLIVNDYSSNRLYNTDAVATDERHVGQAGTIFSWIMTGTASTNLNVTFTFSTLQASLLGKYYRPAYTMVMYQNPTISQNGRDLYDSMYSESSKSVGTYTKNNKTSQYTETAQVSYSGTVPASGASYRDANNNRKTQITYDYWQKTGYCTLNITDYEKNVAGSYEYRCSVTVEFTTP